MIALRVGNQHVEIEQAQGWLDEHVASQLNGWANYDHYDSGTGDTALGEADLMAPGLLNVGITLSRFPALKNRLPEIRKALDLVPTDVGIVKDPQRPDLRVADDNDIRAAADAFVLLDTDRPPGTRLTVYSKVLHRKRPHLLPLYDRNVRQCYCRPTRSEPARIEQDKARSYQRFVELLLRAVQDDLGHEGWSQLRRPEGMSLLRCLDITGWYAGQQPIDT